MVWVLDKTCNYVERKGVLDEFNDSFAAAALHTNTKRIQSEDFILDKKKATTRTLQIDFAMSYQCSEQDECQGKI